MFDTTVIASATYIGSGVGAWQDSGDSPPVLGLWCLFNVTNVQGIPNVLLAIQSSQDQVTITDLAKNDVQGGLVNAPGQYPVRFSTRKRYWRPIWTFYANDPGGTSGNSSSSSAQSAFSSSSSGGTAAITMSIGVAPSING